MSLSSGYSRILLGVFLLGSLLIALFSLGQPYAPLLPIPPSPTDTHILIAEVYYNGYLPNKPDEFVRLYNPTAREVDLSGWSISDGKRAAAFGPGARLPALASVYVAREAATFRQELGHLPDYEYGAETDPNIPNLATADLPPSFPRNGGVVILRDASGGEVDVVVYGEGSAYRGTGWKGPPVPEAQKGEIMDRARDEQTITAASPGLYAADTDMARDWWQGDAWKDLRIYQRGQTFAPYPTFQARAVTAYSSPDTTYRTLAGLIDGARKSIDLCIYEFHLVQLAEKLAAASRRGVKIRLLLEGGPVGGVVDQGRFVAKMIRDAGGEVRFLIHDSQNLAWSRYTFVHAKYGVVDGRRTFVQSENLKPTGTPVDPTAGNRGWGIVIDDDGFGSFMTAVFKADWNPAFRDSFPYTAGTPFGPPAPGFIPDKRVPGGQYPHPFPALTVTGPIDVTPVLAPDHSLLQTKGIIGLMRSARHSLLIEQQYAHLNYAWFSKW